PEDGVRERSEPGPIVPLLKAVEADERKQHQTDGKEAEGTEGLPLGGEMRRHLEQAPGREHDPTRAQQTIAEGDVEERDNSDHDPVPVAAVEEPEEPAADRQGRDDVEPDARKYG